MLDSTAHLILTAQAALILLCDCAVALWILHVTAPEPTPDQDRNTTGWN